MGKGGVGKTSVAVNVAVELARRGHKVHLTTTDPAAHVQETLGGAVDGIRVSRIDPAAETRTYSEEVLRTADANLEAAGRALLEEDLRSPCTEEIAVFRAFARIVDEGEHGFVVMDTAPTGHTLLLLDAESYHREVLRTSGSAPEESGACCRACVMRPTPRSSSSRCPRRRPSTTRRRSSVTSSGDALPGPGRPAVRRAVGVHPEER